MNKMMIGLLAVTTALTVSTSANATLIGHANVNGYQTFQDSSTGLTWLKLNQLFGQTYTQQVANATVAGFKVADAATIGVLQNGSAAINQGVAEWNAVAAITGKSDTRNLIWGNYADVDGTNAWSYAFSSNVSWSAYNPAGTNGYSDLSLFAYVNTTSAVPEPASWAMMIVGLGAIGFAMRRKNVATQVRFA